MIFSIRKREQTHTKFNILPNRYSLAYRPILIQVQNNNKNNNKKKENRDIWSRSKSLKQMRIFFGRVALNFNNVYFKHFGCYEKTSIRYLNSVVD